VVQASSDTVKSSAANESGKGLIDGISACQVQEIPRRDYGPVPAMTATDLTQDLLLGGLHGSFSSQ